MDKRTWLFFFTLMLSFMLVNTYFSWNDQENNQQWIAQQREKKEQEKQKLIAEISQKTAKPEQLSVTALYADKEQKNLLAHGVVAENNLLVLPWTTILPENIYANGLAYHLTTEGKTENSMALYTKEPVQPLIVKTLPVFGTYELQFVFFSSIDDPAFKIYFGEYHNGRVSLAIEQLAKEFPQDLKEPLPSGDALAFLKGTSHYIPVGLYRASSHELIPFSTFKTLAPYTKEWVSKTDSTIDKEEKFYVLENNYQQLVFSNIGGALAEINLPFESDQNSQSIVQEICFDRDMVNEHPENALFPAYSYYIPGDSGKPQLEPKGKLGGYYPLLRRDLKEKPPFESIKINPNNYALNIVSEYPELGELEYKVKSFTQTEIVFEAEQPHRRITKTYTLGKDDAPYCFGLTIQVEGDNRGLWLTTGVPDAEWISGGVAPDLKYRMTKTQGDSSVKSISLPDPSILDSSTAVDWIANSNGFLGLIVDPLKSMDPGFKALKLSANQVPSRLLEIDQEYQRFKPDELPGYAMYLPLNSKGGTMQLRVFAGPFASSVLKQMDAAYSNPASGYNPEYISCQSYHGYLTFISQPISKFLFVLMSFFYQFTGSWGLSIILLTVALRIILYPFNSWSMKSMAKMREISPELQKIQEKYKKDARKMQIETANLYREKGVNPFGGCLPMLLQLPFLIGMFDLLKSSFELRGASFIPGWIDDLAAPDVVFQWHYPIFFIGTAFHLLPVLLGLSMFLQQKLSTPNPTDASKMTDQQRQQQTMMTMMTAVFTIMFYHFPSGLNIYWLSSTILGFLQQWRMNRAMSGGKKA